jgi:hypothetical protein
LFQGYFSKTYPEAREKFHEFAGKAHARISSFVLPLARGSAGEALAMDVAWLGSEAPRGAVIVTSGTHGVEGYAGSGFQCSFLAERAATVLRPDVGVVLVHALNPFGFSHVCRVNELNVDLNRNFIDFSRPPPPRGGYERLHSAIVPREWTGETRMAADRSIEDAWVTLGERGFQQTVCRGQYTRADGLFYGGTAPSWSNITWREYLAGLPRSIELLAHIDIHTGLGPFGYGEIVYSLPAGEHALALASQWYQDLEFRTAGSRESAATPIGGTMNHAVLATEIAESTSISLEFGTVKFRRMFEALRAENWLRVRAPAGLPDEAEIRKELVNCFYTSDTGWQDAVVERCDEVLTRTIACVAERLKARRHAPNGK